MADLLVSLVSAVVVAFGLLYVVVLTVLGIWTTRKLGVPVAAQEALIDEPPDDGTDVEGYRFYVLIPALDEEEVIGGTVDAVLRDQAGSTVVVVDDGSTDRTAEIVSSYEHTGRVALVRRTLPEARQGKGRALNAGLEVVRCLASDSGASRSRAIVVVMDADGRMSPNATSAVARTLRADASVGGMQLVVRIRNRDSLGLSFQDMEFWAISGIGQLGRVPFGSVSMGGNGQFTRLAALDEIGAEPWSDSLTEDLDLGISLAALGWKTTTTPWAYVTQQGVAEVRRLVRQRTRWYQGHMLSIRRLPELARSRYLPTARFLELAAYLVMPWMVSLPWSVLQQYLIIQLVRGNGLPDIGGYSPAGQAVGALAWYLISFAPSMFFGVAYYRRARGVSLPKALVMSHLLIPWSYITHLAVWSALARIVTRRHGWAKTRREVEDGGLDVPGLSAGPLEAPR